MRRESSCRWPGAAPVRGGSRRDSTRVDGEKSVLELEDGGEEEERKRERKNKTH
jgi:hypothetical protein